MKVHCPYIHRYNAGSNSNKTRTGNAGSNSSPVLGLEVTNQENMQDIRSLSSGNPPNQCSNGDSNNIDMGSTTNNAFSKSIVTNNKSAMASTVNCLNPLAQPIKNDSLSVPQQADTTNNGTITTMQTQSNCVHGESQIQQLCHPYDHTHLLAQNNQRMSSERNDFSLKKISAATHCGSSNVLNGPVEGNAANYSVNGSASGSNHGSNGQNGSSTAVNAGGLNMESDNGIGRKSRSGDASGSGSGSGNKVDQDRVSQREAALTKFRQKRKERCFHKKVMLLTPSLVQWLLCLFYDPSCCTLLGKIVIHISRGIFYVQCEPSTFIFDPHVKFQSISYFSAPR